MTTKSPVNLWIFGDSWSALNPQRDPKQVWTRNLAHKLGQELKCSVNMHNYSLIGSSQDWAVRQYLEQLPNFSNNDYVVFIATTPNRYWYFEDMPHLSNWNILDFDTAAGEERARAVEYYIKHIQRPQLDILQATNRMATIAYETRRFRLRKPLIIKGFDQLFGPAENYPDLDIAQGNLSDIQWDEYIPAENMKELLEEGTGYFNGHDCRYNHLCLSNHKILTQKIIDFFINGKPLDLTQGFEKELISLDWHTNFEFIEQQLNPYEVEVYKTHIASSKFTPWKTKTGIDKLFKKLAGQS